MDLIEYRGSNYPKFQTEGFASQFSIPYALKFCKGHGYDIGYGKDEWKFPGSNGIDLKDGTDALSLPEDIVDYIYSSHCLEHLPNWIEALDHWISRIKSGGILFLYLPDFSQEYWRPWNNRKHKQIMNPDQIREYLVHKKCSNIFMSGTDLNNSFMVVCSTCLY